MVPSLLDLLQVSSVLWSYWGSWGSWGWPQVSLGPLGSQLLLVAFQIILSFSWKIFCKKSYKEQWVMNWLKWTWHIVKPWSDAQQSQRLKNKAKFVMYRGFDEDTYIFGLVYGCSKTNIEVMDILYTKIHITHIVSQKHYPIILPCFMALIPSYNVDGLVIM